MQKTMHAVLGVAALCVVAAASTASAQTVKTNDPWCDNGSSWGDRVRHCEVREWTLPRPTGTFIVDAGRNGGIKVKGWDRPDVLVRAKVETAAEEKYAALNLSRQVSVRAETSRVSAEGPDTGRGESWSVSYELMVPAAGMDLSLKANNGGVSVAGVRGQLDFTTRNGGVTLSDLAGRVHGNTHNGGVTVDLQGARWDGEGLDVTTHNGGVRLTMPGGYAARLETGTENGGFNIDFPVTVQGRLGRQLVTDLNGGGPTIRVVTTNGGVSVRRR